MSKELTIRHKDNLQVPTAQIHMSREYLQFIKEHSLGKILPYRVQSGFRQYTPVVFDLDKLQELDSEGVKRFKQEHDIPNRQPRTNKYEHER